MLIKRFLIDRPVFWSTDRLFSKDQDHILIIRWTFEGRGGVFDYLPHFSWSTKFSRSRCIFRSHFYDHDFEIWGITFILWLTTSCDHDFFIFSSRTLGYWLSGHSRSRLGTLPKIKIRHPFFAFRQSTLSISKSRSNKLFNPSQRITIYT